MSAQTTDPLQDICHRSLQRLFGRVHPDADESAAHEIVDRCVSSPPDGWRSLVSDDHTPVELSLACTRDTTELRLLFEAAGEEPTAASQGRAAQRVNAWIEERFGARTEQLRAIERSFLPEEHQGCFGLWHAAVFEPGGHVRFKAYLDPYARGRARAADLVERALAEIGNPRAWDAVARLAGRGPALDELRFFSVDLVAPEVARVKVYVSKHRTSFAELLDAAERVRHGDVDGLARYLATVSGAESGVLAAERPVVTCLDFVGDDPTPRHLTVHFPVRAYAPDDEVAMARAAEALEQAGAACATLADAVGDFASRPLSAGSGMIPYISHRGEAEGGRITVYLSTEARETHAPHPLVRPQTTAPPPTGSIEATVQRFAAEPISFHPFLQRLAREPLAMERLCLVLLNFQQAITRDFARRLAQTVARVDDDTIRSILAKQLNDELGNGDPTAAHRLLFDRFVDGMRDYAPDPLPSDALRPAARLAGALESLYVLRPEPYVGVGATLMMEVYGQQVDQFLGDQFRRQSELPPAVMEWLTLHEELENDHVDEVFDLARRIPDGPPTRDALSGVEALATAGWSFFDELYRVAWPA